MTVKILRMYVDYEPSGTSSQGRKAQGSFPGYRSGERMNFVALKMLVADRAKYFSLIVSIAFASFLLGNQISIFIGIMTRPSSQVQDVVDADVWVMDPQTLYDGEVYALRDYDLYRVRSVPGVEWAVPLYKGTGRAKGPDGKFRNVILMGVDDATLVGAPRKMLVGSIYDLDQPDAAIIDKAGYFYFFPGEPLQAGKTLQMNEKRVLIVGISDASAPFQSFPVLHTRYSQALGFVGPTDATSQAYGTSQITTNKGYLPIAGSSQQLLRQGSRMLIADLTPLHQGDDYKADLLSGHHSDIFQAEIYRLIAQFAFN